jgi:hypothetical protein
MPLHFSNSASKTKHKLDFTLAPIAIILIELAVFFTQLPNELENNLRNLIVMRVLHTVLMLLIAMLVSQIFMRTHWTEHTFFSLALTGIVVIAIGDVLHGYLASLFDVELVSAYRRLGIILIQGSLWFPAFMIVGGNRKAIFHQFREYENRLIAATRALSRTSLEFKEAQRVIQDRIRSDFYATCADLRGSIHSHQHRKQNLSQQYDSIAPLLLGEELRKLSRSLDISSSSTAHLIRLGKRRDSFNLFIQQFRLLYTSIVRSTPLPMRTYAFMLIALVTPPFINFYSLSEFFFSYPILLFSIFLFSQLVVRAQSSKSTNALRNASILVFLTGLLPLIVNLVGQSITHNPQSQFPLFITALALPITYYISMELLQVLRPGSLSLIRNDQLKASPVLQKKVRAIVRDDFSQTLSHQWAVFIHGKTLTRLAATSLKLKAAADAGDSRTFDQSLDALLTSLENPDAEFEEVASDLQTELSSRLDPWRGFVDIKLTIAQELASMRNLRVRVIGEVIEELLSNSIRHGKAKEIELRVITAGDNEIDIIALDDATIAPAKSLNRAGLGTRIFNLASDGRWSITRVGSSTQFKLRMSIEK